MRSSTDEGTPCMASLWGPLEGSDDGAHIRTEYLGWLKVQMKFAYRVR